MSDKTEQSQHSKKKEQLVLFSVVTTFLALIPTAWVAYISNSVTLVADLLRCLVEFLSILFAWLVLRKIRREDLSTYNYGFGKLEQISSLSVAAALLVAFIISLSIGLKRIWEPTALENSEFGLLLAILSVVGNAIVWFLNYKQWKQSGSALIDSQWRLFRAKTVACLVVVVSLVIGGVFSHYPLAYYADPTGGIVIAAFLLYSAYTITSSSMNDLVDRSLEEALQLLVLRALVKHDNEYSGLQRIRSRRAGGKIYIELFLEFNPERKMADVQKSIELIRAELKENISGSEIVVVPS